MKILCATELTRKSDAAVDRAALLATRLDAELVLLHAVPHSTFESVLEQSLRASMERMKERTRAPHWRHALAPNTMVRIGSAADVVARAAEEIGADLVVLGPHDRETRGALAGTTAARVLSERRWPVLIARQPVHGAYRGVLLALDLYPESAAVIRAAESLVLRDETSASVVHSCHVPYNALLDAAGMDQRTIADFPGMVTAQAHDNIVELLARESDGSIDYRVTVSRDTAATAIEKVAGRLQPDLIVMGTRGHGPVRRALLGSVATRVMESAMTDVLVVPEQKTAALPRASVMTRGAVRSAVALSAAEESHWGRARKTSSPMRPR
jgi:nucleotide-binding universal stress UspA family protein